ncbi:hypothetical protein BRD56_02350 [Thermoplasmatales archaeon SW_10_69_26]|nr:MAG: hypothetical protein BRD56_02350 [Thermoplasmatales archaeon SW_10_69_26]
MRRIAVLALLVLSSGCLGALDTDQADAPDDLAEEPIREAQLSPGDRSASEVAVATDPTNPAHVVAAANSDTSEEDGFGVYETTDAGQTWNATSYTADEVRQPPEGPSFEAISDPVPAFGPEGTLYLAGLTVLPTSAIFVAESPDGDQVFEETHIVHESDVASEFNDKEWLGVNPRTGTLHVAWQQEPALDQLRQLEQEAGVDADIGEIVHSRSTDGGDSWTDPRVVSRGMQSNGTQIAFTAEKAHMIWVNYDANTIDHVTSTDDGETWSDPEPIAPVATVAPYERYQRMHTLPALAADETGSDVYAVWHDSAHGDADVLAAASPDAGETWTDPVRVHDDEPGNGVIQFYPWATVDPDGNLHVTWYDARHNPQEPTFAYHHALAEGPALNFTPTGPVSNETFTPFAGDEQGNGTVTLGDYTGVAASEAGVFPAWADARENRAQVFGARVAGEGAHRGERIE